MNRTTKPLYGIPSTFASENIKQKIMKNIFEKDLSGEMVSPDEPGYEALISDIFATIETATKMNTGYRTPEEVHEYMGRILGKPLEESTTVLPPLYIDYGKPVTIGRGGGVSFNSVARFSVAAASRSATWYSSARRSI